jgi:hypothetical protein
MTDVMAMAAEVEAVMTSGDFPKMQELIQRYATDDFVEEWPQSGERLTRETSLRLAEAYPAMSGTQPKATFRRMLGGGDLFVVEGTIDYGDGIPVNYVAVGELRDGKVFRMTEYFANPFEQPEWRKGVTELMTPAGA